MTRPFVVFNAASRYRRELVEVPTDGAGRSSCRSRCPRAATPRSTSTRRGPSFAAVTVTDRLARERAAARHVGRRRVCSRRSSTRSSGARCSRPDARGNLFQLHDDNPRDFDAWNVDREYLDHRVDLTAVTSIEVVEQDPLRAGVRFVREFGDSTDHADGAARERIAPARLRHRGRLARAPQVPEGRVPGRRAREPRDLRDPVRPSRTADAREHVVGRRPLRGVRAPVGRSRASPATASRCSTTASTATTSTAT